MGLANLQYYKPTSLGANGKERRQQQQQQQPQKKAEPEKVKKPEHAMRGVARQKVTQSKLHQVQKPRPQETVGKKRSSRTAKAKLSGDGPVKETPLKRFMLEDPCTAGRAKARSLPLKTLPDVKKTGVAAHEKDSSLLKTGTTLDTTDAAVKATEEGLLREALMPLSKTLPSVKGKGLSDRGSVTATATKKVAEEEKSVAKRSVDPFTGKPFAPMPKSKPPKVPSPKRDTTLASTKDKSRRAADLPKLDVTATTNIPEKSKINEEPRQQVSPLTFSFPQLDGNTPSPTATIKKSGLAKKALPKTDCMEGPDFGTHAKPEASWVSTKQQGMKSSRSIPQMSHVETGHLCERHRPRPPPPDWKMYAWERGEIDYMGADRFSNILARIRSTIQEVDADNLPIGTWL
ncbi:unnamed protein product [Dibothriocephalus latus]|uniref:Uncharacterized protein n=1 Tax=Dibothriocephalus latus TaxID=60516 RepID=A0A3P7M2U7_DIBLA|nr:unnamed protein product [Dibothriocephalus latus]